MLASIGTVGYAYDNAMAESFADSFKTELIADRVWRTRSQLESRDRRMGALVFPTVTGNPHSASNVRRTMRTICEVASDRLVAEGGPPLPKLTPHALRRTWRRSCSSSASRSPS